MVSVAPVDDVGNVLKQMACLLCEECVVVVVVVVVLLVSISSAISQSHCND